MRKIPLLLAVLAIAQGGMASGLPEVAAPFAPSRTGRQAAALKAFNVSEAGGQRPRSRPSPTLVSGNKAIGVNGLSRFLGFLPSERFVVSVDGRELAWGQFWGNVKGVGGGAPFLARPGTAPKVDFDEAGRSITYYKEYCLTPTEAAAFSWTLQSLSDGKVRLSWNLGVAAGRLPGVTFGLQLIFEKHYRALGVACDGKPLTLLTATEQRDLKADKELRRFSGPGSVTVAPDAPAAGFGLLVGKGCEVSIVEGMNLRRDGGQLCVYVNPKPLEPAGSVEFDLGEVALAAADVPLPRAGVDFWAADRMEMPLPTTANLVPNPSFEQGLRHWSWWFAGTINYSPSDTPCYELTRDAKFGRQALRSNGTCGNKELMSFPIPVEMGKDYTLSFYAKADKPTTFTFGLGLWPPGERLSWTADKQWRRYVHTFAKDAGRPFVQLFFQGAGVTLDGLQLEEGSQATGFVAPAVEGRLVTADPDNCLQVGGPLAAALELSGRPELSGELELTVYNYYRERLFAGKFPFVLDKDGAGKVALPLDAKALGKGVFVARVEYHVPGAATLVDHYRFSIMDFLENKHATREFFGNHMPGKTTRNDTLAKLLSRWGWGARHGAVTPYLSELKSIPYYCALIEAMLDTDQQKRLYGDNYQDYQHYGSDKFRVRLDSLTSKEALVEQISYEVAKAHPELRSWAWSSETDGRSSWVRSDNYAEHAKILRAMRHGVKRANPDALVLPDGGPANMESGWKQIDAFLSPVTTLDSFKWDAVAIHPYLYSDDVDSRTAQLLAVMAKRGYGKDTPVYFTEGGNTTDTWIPAWSSAGWYDDYPNGRPSYDTGWQEFKKAAWDARRYLVGLKYWPQLRYISIWTALPYFDMAFAPLMDCAAVNTLGHLFSNPKFVADISPVEGVKGLAFEDDKGRGLATVWSSGDGGDVERGLKPAPKLRVKFGADTPEFIDLMGNVREAKPVDGVYEIPLSPAPLFVRGPAGSAARLAAALNAAVVVGAGAVLKADLKPDVGGNLVATLSNKTVRELEGTLACGKGRLPFKIPASGSCQVVLGKGLPTVPGSVRGLKGALDIALSDGSSTTVERSLAWFFVPRAAKPLPLNPSSAEWLAVPAIPLTNWAPAGGKPGDLDAKFQLAWDKDNLYLRVEAADDHFRTDPEQWKSLPPVERERRLYEFDGCVEVYFDTFADAGRNLSKGYDNNDCRYDFYAQDGAASDGPGRVWRQVKVFSQLAGGLTFPTDTEVARDVKCEFHRDGGKYFYVMVFPARYLQPLELVRGQVAGFGLDIHDKEPGDGAQPSKKLSFSTEPGECCWQRPDRWPLMILGD